MKKKVFVGFSGGVDSSVSTYLLKKKYDVSAVIFLNTQDQDIESVKSAADHIGVPLLIVDMQEEFKDMVIKPFLKSYMDGNTPNPCVNCNIEFKFGHFAKWCFENGADFIATGHYCKTKNGRLYRGKDSKKDQSYFLNGISSEILQKTIFPVGNLTKEKVREIAGKVGLPNSSKRDSQEICFIKTSTSEYLNKEIDTTPGNIVDIDTNEIVGKHNGLHALTLGQRKGIQIGGSDMPYFVARKDSISNTIFVAKGKLNPHLWKDTFVLESFNTINQKNLNVKNGLTAMVRHRSKEIKCDVSWDLRTVYLKEKVWTPSLDQSLVIYKGDECIGGGKIKEIRQ